MSNLIKTQQQPISELMNMAKAFAESGMFPDTKTAAQAIVKIQAGQEIGIPPFASMGGVHIIQGKPIIGAGLIASCVKGSGKYNYRVLQQDEKICSIDFYEGKEMVGNSTFTIEDAKKAQTKNIDKFPRNMLFARAISNGVKWYCPDVFAGPVYVPEDMGTVDTTYESIIDYEYAINNCESEAEIKEIYNLMSKEEREKYKQLCIDKKTKLNEESNN